MKFNFNHNYSSFVHEVRDKNQVLTRDQCVTFNLMQNFLTKRDIPNNFENVFKIVRPAVEKNKIALNNLKSNLSTFDNSIEYFHELIIGSLLVQQFDGDYEIYYSPKIKDYTPDWMIETEHHKLVVEVVTLNRTNNESTKTAFKGLVYDMVKHKLGHDDFKIHPKMYEIEYDKTDDYYENQARNVVNRILSEVDTNKVIIPKRGEKEPLIVMSRRYTFSQQLTTTGYESYRVFRSITEKANKYKFLKKPYYLIIAVVMQSYYDSKIFYPNNMIELIENPDSVNNPEYSRICDKERHIEEMERNTDGLKSINGLMFIETNRYHNFAKIPSFDDINHHYYNNALYDGVHDASEILARYPLFTDKREAKELCS